VPDGTRRDHPPLVVRLHAGDEEHAPVRQLGQQREAHAALVEHRDAARRQKLPAPEFGVRGMRRVDRGEHRQVAAVVEADVQLHRRLAVGEMGPGKQRQRQLDQRGVEGQQLGLEAEAMARGRRLHRRRQLVEQRLEQGMGLARVEPGQRRAGHRRAAQMIQARPLRRQHRFPRVRLRRPEGRHCRAGSGVR
jgi:hypothetical protein